MSFQRINELIVVKVTAFSGTTGVNKNGVPPVMIQCIAGKIPNKNTVDGTVAARSGFEEDKSKPVNKVAQRNLANARRLRQKYYGEHTNNSPSDFVEGNMD